MQPVHARSHHVPAAPVYRTGCPCVITPFSQTAVRPPGDMHPVLRQFTPMRLVHQAKDDSVKYSYSLKHIHDDLATTSLALRGSGSSNILNSFVSFECRITTPTGVVRDHFPLSLKIKGTNTAEEQVLSYEMVEKAYGSKAKLYAAMKYIYQQGLANAQNLSHGHQPDYNPHTYTHDQYIRHTEQLLVAYLAEPEAAQALFDQLHGAIRAKYHEATSAKVYNMVLHIDSTKTCCAPCEYALLGFMNDRNGFRFPTDPIGMSRGFMRNFTQAAAKPSQTLPISLPANSPFRVLVTVTATEADADHKKQPRYNVTDLKKQSVPDYNILVKSADASSKIYTTMVNQKYDGRKIPQETNLSGKTIGISGSKSTKGSPGTIAKVKSIRKLEDEADHLLSRLGNLFI